MTHRYIKIGATVLVLAAAFSGLMWSSLREGTEYYKHVDEVMNSPEQWHDKKLQLHGFVVANSIAKKPNSLDYWFQVHQNGKTVSATYTGVVPDTFKSDSEVVLKGTLSADGFSVAPNGVMAKCPSKYEANAGGAKPSGTY
jgi:cytochrome c-type biogenesis protein CcmE